jgi:hypothetical protein
MKWFERHLNWTAVFSWLASYPLFIMFIALGAFLIDPYIINLKGIAEDVYIRLSLLIAAGLPLFVSGWALRRKSRRLWWLLILFVPFGAIIFLCLKNQSQNLG